MRILGQTLAVSVVALLSIPIHLWQPQPAQAQLSLLCAAPGRDGTASLSGIANTYYIPASSGTLASGATSVTLGSAQGANVPIAAGDLLLLIQMQDAQINSTNSDAYGDGVAGGGNANLSQPPSGGSTGASGSSNLANSGRYEYVVATSAVPLSGGTLTFKGGGANAGLVYSYRFNAATATRGQRRYQIIRVPQLANASLAGLTALPWNGRYGGVAAVDVMDQLTFGAVNVTGRGFRGGGGRGVTTGNAGLLASDYRTLATQNPNGSKGEGIAGTPRFLYDTATSTTALVDTGSEGYPDGSFGRGAPGNAGGGGTDGNPAGTNDQNSGGGGGGNGGAGGMGGRSWSSQLYTGGFGGSFTPEVNRVVLGGGGGAGSRNNSSGIDSSGGTGGGVVLIRAGRVSGSGTIEANGTAGDTPENDGGGGGGAGGAVSVLVKSGSLAGLTVSAQGGAGGNAHVGGVPHGPGGGGGGGHVVLSAGASATVNVGGGANGYTVSAGNDFGATPGATGVTQTTSIDSPPGALPGAVCPPNLRLVKRITRINDQVFDTWIDDPDPSPDPSVPSETIGSIDNLPYWPAGFLVGGGLRTVPAPADPVDDVALKSGDAVEYTIYFLSDGFRSANGVQLCDRVPSAQTFVPDAFNGSPTAPGGSPTGDRGISVLSNGSTLSYTNAADGDTARYYDPTETLPNACGGGTSESGAIVVDLGNLSQATAPGSPTDSYGFVRFRARVK